MKLEIIKYNVVSSTNDVAMDLINNKKKESGCVYSKLQTKGRGTKGREWVSAIGNLFTSIFFPLKNDYPPFNEFSIINPVIVSDVIKKYCGNKNISFKWPNDVFVNGKKICGILQEVITSGESKFLIIGIGINTNLNPKNSSFLSTSLKHITKKNIDNKKLFIMIKKSYEKFLYKANQNTFSELKKFAKKL